MGQAMIRFWKFVGPLTIALFTASQTGAQTAEAPQASALGPQVIRAEIRPNPELDAFLASQGYRPVTMQKLRTGHETLSVTINGITGLFVLDSGASASVVHYASREKFTLTETVGMARDATGAGGAVRMTPYSVATMQVGDVEVPHNRVIVGDLTGVVAALRTASGVEIDGVIGQDILTRFRGVIDVGAQRLYLNITPAVAP